MGLIRASIAGTAACWGHPAQTLNGAWGKRAVQRSLHCYTILGYTWKGASQAGSLVGPEYNTLRRNWSIGYNLTKEVETGGVRIARKQALLD